jgi:hypothetical protein
MKLRRLLLPVAVATLALLAAACGPVPPPAGEFTGPTYTGAGSPTGFKAESKLWYHSGSWWAVMFDPTSTDYHVFKHDKTSQAWTKTATSLDDRPSTNSDVLFDGTKLYVLSHVYAETALPDATTQTRLYRLSFVDGAWTLDTGFPKTVDRGRAEVITLAKDSTGRLWATWVEAAAVKYTTSADDGLTWEPHATLPGPAATQLTTDDISAVVSFNGQVGILWSAQLPDTLGATALYFATHVDGEATDAWTTETVLSGPRVADDHLSLVATADGTVRAVAKTSAAAGEVEVNLVTRTPAGVWTAAAVWRRADGITRPVLVIESTNGRALVYGTSPEGGGDIYRKVASLAAPVFPVGKGDKVIDDEALGSVVNDPSATKQVVTTDTDLVVLASDNADRTYWHHWDPLTS